MTIRFSPSTGLFYDAALHPPASLPGDAVTVSARRHAQLLELQAGGRTIAAARDGRPYAIAPRAPTLEERRTAASRAIATEASKRILAVASLERQSNDNALMAVTVLTGGDSDAVDVQEALVRRLQIDAIRAASNRLEAAIAVMSARQISALEIAADHHWPKG
ncbi:hypothetical protein FHS96_003083 [Sphingomonas zeicaulis]|uniref:hypothetical protein n=1 Tax=Sphingomonas zeicaulis TaxID=1632740 RepID=UPI003D25BD5C